MLQSLLERQVAAVFQRSLHDIKSASVVLNRRLRKLLDLLKTLYFPFFADPYMSLPFSVNAHLVQSQTFRLNGQL